MNKEQREEIREWLGSHGLPHNEVEGDLLIDYIIGYAEQRERQARIDELKMLRQGSKENAKDGKGFDFVTSIISRINDLKETTNE